MKVRFRLLTTALLFSLCACVESNEDRGLTTILARLEFVCDVDDERFEKCSRRDLPTPTSFQRGRSYIFEIPNTKDFDESWNVFQRRIGKVGYEITRNAGNRGEKVVSLYHVHLE